MKMLIFVMVSFLSFLSIDAQEFQISEGGARDFTIDKRTQIVYMKDPLLGTIYEYDAKTEQTKISRFTSLPTFANKKHLAIYNDGTGTYFYDFEKDSTSHIDGVIAKSFIMFSPNDSAIVANDGENFYYYFFSRNEIHYTFSQNLVWESPPPSWSSDTTMMFRTIDHKSLVNINLFTSKIDTIFTTNMQEDIYWFNYEPGFEFITLSYPIEQDYSPKIRRYYLTTKKDTIVYDFDTENPTSHCKGSPFGFRSMKWSPDSKKFSFIGYFYTVSGSSVYCYFLDSNKTYLYGTCDEYGLKGNLEWLNNDTIIYADYTRYLIYGYDVVSPITSVVEEFNSSPTNIALQSYPNPFNSSTTIMIELPYQGNIRLKIYNVLGEIVKQAELGLINKGKYDFKWNGKNDNGNTVSTGLYIIQLESDVINKENQNAFLKILFIK